MKRILLLSLILGLCLNIYGQAKKQPSIMVVPSNQWCFSNGYSKSFSDNGSIKTVPDYERAFLENDELKFAISSINDIFAGRGFHLVSMERTLTNISTSKAEDIVTTSKTGASIEKTALDIVKERAKPDIVLDLSWTFKEIGPNHVITFNLEALDSYTGISIGSAVGTGNKMESPDLSLHLQRAVQGTIGKLQDRIQSYFDDIRENGRIVVLEIQKWDDCPYDLEDEFGGQELTVLIEDWVSDNSVGGQFSVVDDTPTHKKFDPVRISLYDSNGRAQDTTRWARGLASYLKTLGINTKVINNGLGYAKLILGGK